jgi:D-threonate/D-erythronate kinase
MLDCLLIADDLTGACDASVPFAMRGRRAVAMLDIATEMPSADILAVTTNSRDLGIEAVRRLMCEAARRLPFRDARLLFKKIDSTMRGNVGGEVAAAVEVFGCDAAVITPAFPAVGRVVEAGYLRLTSGQTFPPIEVARRLRWQGAEPCRHVRPGAVELSERFISVDATCDGDLDGIVREVAASGKRVLWAGSGGLAAALARTLPKMGTVPIVPCGSPLFCIGSDQPVTLAQLDRLIAERPASRVMRVARGMPAAEVREAVREAGALVLSGGDTALLVCRAISADRIEVVSEILPGIPHGILRGGMLDGIAVATKAGGFGGPDALIHVADFFR